VARVPALPYRVIVHNKPLAGQVHGQVETHNYANLPGAWAYRDIALRRPRTRKVEVVFVLDEATPSHPS
jgi:hypothetical protein